MRKLELHHYIFAAMLLGAGIGLPLNWLAARGDVDAELVRTLALIGQQIGALFLRLLQMVVVPLIILSLLTAVTGLGAEGGLGRLGRRAVALYLTTTTAAVLTGLMMVNLVTPGRGADPSLLGDHGTPSMLADTRSVTSVLWDQVLRMVPKNPIAAAAEGEMLPVIFFTLLLGVFINGSSEDSARLLRSIAQAGFDVMMRMTMFVVRLSPAGVFGFMLATTADHGAGTFQALGAYVVTVLLALAFHGVFTVPLVIAVLAKRSPWRLAKAVSPALLTAFSTASSNATLPLTMTTIEQRAGVDQRTSAFVLPLGATINMDGTALYEVVAVLFIAQVMGLDLPLSKQLLVAVTALLVSVGAAGIPHAGTVMMVIVLDAVGLPASGVGIILAVDRVLDMFRTAINVWSDVACASVVDRIHRADVGS